MKRVFEIKREVTLGVKEEAFTQDFLSEFRRSFYDFDSLDDHLAHLSWLVGTGNIYTPLISSQFVEGYGEIGEFLESAKVVDLEIERSDTPPKDT